MHSKIREALMGCLAMEVYTQNMVLPGLWDIEVLLPFPGQNSCQSQREIERSCLFTQGSKMKPSLGRWPPYPRLT